MILLRFTQNISRMMFDMFMSVFVICLLFVRYFFVFASFSFVPLHGYPPSQEQGDEEDDVTDSDGNGGLG